MNTRIVILLFLFPLVCYAANTPRNLEKKLASAPKEEKVNLLNEIAFSYRGNSPAKVREYAEKALRLARQSSDKSGEALSLKNIGLSHFLIGEYEECLEYYFQAQTIYKEISFEKGTAIMNVSIGNVTWRMGDFESAMKYYRQALDILRESGENRIIAGLWNNMGNVYFRWGKYADALDAYIQSLEIKKTLKQKNPNGTALTLNNIGLAYRELEDTEKALEFHRQALDIMKELKNKKGIGISLNNIALVYNNTGEFDKALEFLERSRKIKEELKDNPGLAVTLEAVGDVYRNSGDTSRAMDYYLRVLELRKKLKDAAGIAEAYLDIGCTYHKIRDYENAVLYLEKAVPLAKKIKTRETLHETLDLLSRVYKRKGDETKSREYRTQALTVKDEMFNRTTNKRIRELQLKYETGQIKTRFAVKEQQWMVFILAAVLLLSFALVFLYFVARSRRRIISKTDALLQRKDMEIEYRVRQIQQINDELKGLKKKKKKKKYEGSKLTPQQSEDYLVRLIRYIEQEKPFREEELTLNELSERTGIPPRDLSRVINEKLHKHFSDFINFYRVEEAKQFLLHPVDKDMTILDIAFEVGFNSKSTFNSVFKKQTGITPSQFKAKHPQGVFL